MKLFVSGYGSRGGSSIGYYDVDFGDLSSVNLNVSDVEKSSFVCCHEDLLFGLSEKSGNSSIHMLRAVAGGYELVESRDIEGSGLCHITYLVRHKTLVGSCYGSGLLFGIKVNEAGFGDFTSQIVLGANSDGITRAHCAVANGDESLLFVTNIASDVVYMYDINDGELVQKNTIQLKKGEGPRHIYVDDEKELVYIITEYSNQIIGISTKNGEMKQVFSVSTLPEGFRGKSFCSTMAVSMDKKFMYGANRGDESIAVFAVGDDGALSLIEHVSSVGSWPRDITLIDGDSYLCVACERSDKVVFLKRDVVTGKLTGSEGEILFGKPSCILER